MSVYVAHLSGCLLFGDTADEVLEMARKVGLNPKRLKNAASAPYDFPNIFPHFHIKKNHMEKAVEHGAIELVGLNAYVDKYYEVFKAQHKAWLQREAVPK